MKRIQRLPFFLIVSFFLVTIRLPAQTSAPKPLSPEQEAVIQMMLPYSGPSAETDRIDNTTLTGKVMCGYQGWFTAEGDGAKIKWIHYAMQGRFEPGFSAVDLWPDMEEMDEDEKFPTPFKLADGRTAAVFSSLVPKTVERHFRWMKENRMHGVFLQRFPATIGNPELYRIRNTVLANVRQAANQTGRCWTLMYDLSGLEEGGTKTVIMEDWKRLSERMKIGRDPNDKSYLRHRGKPLIAVWGIGFNDNRPYTLAECLELITFLKEDPTYGGFSVMVGVPTYWRERHRDAVNDPLLHEIIKKADIVSPWTVGRYDSPEKAVDYVEKTVKADLLWCRANGIDLLPVVFPGFSWQNLMKGRGKEAPLNAIPRRKGDFLEAQYKAHVKAGIQMIYQAMFDEIDEGTAIFKCTNDVPVGESRFATYEGLPSDFYLKLVGRWSKTLEEKMARDKKND